MASVGTLTVFMLILFFATMTEGEKKKSVDKIIIHVPYKIHKHHHTHTKYKVITIPSPKKENTVIYLKEQIQPVIKEVPVSQTQVEIAATQPDLSKVVYQTSQMIDPPHQQSAQPFLESVLDHKNQIPTHVNQQHEYSTIDQKPLESHSAQNLQGFIPDVIHKPVVLPSGDNHVHDYSFKPVAIPHHSFIPKFTFNPLIHQSYNVIPKFSYHPIIHLSQEHFLPQYGVKTVGQKPGMLHDSVAHTSSQVYKTVLPGLKPSSYKVKEEIQEGEFVKHKTVPLLNSKQKGKTFGQKYQLKNMNKIPLSPDYDYEHVGYLIIDGNSRKIVGKNLKDELRLSR